LNSEDCLDENLKRMESAMRGVDTGEVTYAVRNSNVNGFAIDQHDILG